MKTKIVLTFVLLYIINGVSGQPSETIYPGNVIRTGFTNNNAYGPFNIGFDFTFFGNTYSEFYVSSNGLVTFDTLSTDGTEDPIPTAGFPNNMIAAFWDDLVVDPSGNILYTTIGASPNRKLIIQFRNMGFYVAPAYLGTFSVILYETTNRIQVQYRSIILPSSTTAHGGNATIGIENADGTDGVQYAWHNPSAVTSGQAISYTPSGSAYTLNDDALYDGVYLTTNTSLPEPGLVTLISPDNDAVIGPGHIFRWSASSNAASYTLKISTSPNLSGAINYNPGLSTSYEVSGLTVGATCYWGIFATNATGTTWCEIKKFTVSATPPLVAVPQTVWVEHGGEKMIRLGYTGGDASAKTANVTSLPLSGELYQVSGGARGARITAVPVAVTDPGFNLIYIAAGSAGNGAGNFNFSFQDNSGTSGTATITVNVSPEGVPNVLHVARSASTVEIQFDIPMSDPSGKENQFMVIADYTGIEVKAANLKAGDPNTIELVLASPLIGSELLTVSYTQGDVTAATDGYLFTFYDYNITLLAQTIDFSQTLDLKFNESPVALNATASSGLGLTYSSSNLSVATVSGNIVTFVTIGTSDITAHQAGNSAFAPARFIRTLTISDPVTKTLNLTSVLLQGLYNTGGIMRQASDDYGPHWPAGVADHITVELHSSSNYQVIVYTAGDVPLATNGVVTISIPAEYGASYYITIKHRNHIETTTASPVSFTGSEVAYSFDSPSNIFGGNLLSYNGRYLIYSGDVDRDGFVGASDMSNIDNQSAVFAMGYITEDVDGDGFVGASDMSIVDNNSALFIFSIIP